MAQVNAVLAGVMPLVRRRFLPLWLAAGWPFLLMAICYLCAGFDIRAHAVLDASFDPRALWDSMGAGARIGILLVFVASAFLPRDLATAGIARVISADLQGLGVKPGSFAAQMADILVRLVILSLAFGSACLISGAFLLLPGLFVSTCSGFVMSTLAIENRSFWDTQRAGLSLAFKRFGALLLLHLVLGIAAFVAFGTVVMVMAATESLMDLPWWVGSVIGWSIFVLLFSLFSMFGGVVTVLLYLDTRQREAILTTPEPA